MAQKYNESKAEDRKMVGTIGGLVLTSGVLSLVGYAVKRYYDSKAVK